MKKIPDPTIKKSLVKALKKDGLEAAIPYKLVPETEDERLDEAINSTLRRGYYFDYQIYETMMFIDDNKAFTKEQKLALMEMIEILFGAKQYNRPARNFEGARNNRFDEVDKEVKRQAAKQGIRYNKKKGYLVTKNTKTPDYKTENISYRPKTVKTRH